MVGSDGLHALDGEKYISLETYRRSGMGVRTPVWFALAPASAAAAKLYVYTTADSGKAKRIRRSGAARIAPCDVRGRITGAWIDAQARIVGDPEFAAGMQLLNQKYAPWKQLLDLWMRVFPRHQRIVIAIQQA